MRITPLHIAALAVAAVDGLQAVGTRGPNTTTPDFQYGGVLDARGRHWVVKVPLNTHAATIVEAEAGLAPSLIEQLRSGNLPFDVMRPAGFAQVDHGRALVYAAPMGKTIDFEDLTAAGAHELGRSLASIHQLSPSVIDNAGMPVYDADTVRRRILTELSDATATGEVPAILRRRWENALENDALWSFEPKVVHGDVAPEQFLWSEGSVSCVLGFGEAHVGDPAQDFAHLISGVSEELFDNVFQSYSNALEGGVDEHFFTRTVLLSELALMRWLIFGIRHNDGDIVADGRDMLADLAAEIESDPELAPGPAWKVDHVSDDFAVEDADEAGFSSHA